jgi:predicted nuclease of restriction endonuclease-like (RecB) superfamily
MGARKKPSKRLPRATAETRLALGRARDDGQARFPLAPPKSELPSGYGLTLRELKARIQRARLRTVLAANAAMIQLYWDMGRTILARQAREGWGAKVIDRLAADLREAFPDMSGLSHRNLLFMRSFAAAYPEAKIVKQLVSQLPWGHIVKLLQRVKTPEARHWYMRRVLEEGWSRSTLETRTPTVRPAGQGPHQLRSHAATRRLRPGDASVQRPVPLRHAGHRRPAPRGRGGAGARRARREVPPGAGRGLRVRRSASSARSR